MSADLVWTIVGTGSGISVAVVGGYWALTKFALKQISARFADQEKARAEGRKASDERLGRIEEAQRRLERDFLEHKADLPREYVRREDHIRYETVVNAKLDALASKLDLVAERTAGKGA